MKFLNTKWFSVVAHIWIGLWVILLFIVGCKHFNLPTTILVLKAVALLASIGFIFFLTMFSVFALLDKYCSK